MTTLFGRRRLVPDINSRNGQIRSAAERVAVNMPIQGTAADVLKRAMIDLHAALARSGARERGRMILTVHDELLVEAREDAVDEIAEIVRVSMQSAASLEVPLTVDVGVGANWKDAGSELRATDYGLRGERKIRSIANEGQTGAYGRLDALL